MSDAAIDKSPLGPGDFREFFRAFNFKPGTSEPANPFRWQERLVAEVIKHGPPLRNFAADGGRKDQCPGYLSVCSCSYPFRSPPKPTGGGTAAPLVLLRGPATHC